MLNHLAIIMDGNRRWGKENSLSLYESYEKGVQNVQHIVQEVIKNNIKNLTLYALSKENLKRSKFEVDILMSLFSRYLAQEIDNLNREGIKLKIIGNINNLSNSLKHKIAEAEQKTQANDKLNLFIAFSYSGKEEIIDALKAFSKDHFDINQLTEDMLMKYTYFKEVNPVDLLIRTGGERRLSNFLLLHISYAELYFTDIYWPAFDSNQLILAINEYERRKRNFGTK